MEREEDEQHPILAKPWLYRVVHVDWYLAQDRSPSWHIDLTFAIGRDIRRLRFLRPRDVKIRKGFCGDCHGLMILDISRRQWDDAKVEVINFEQDPGITFIAADVVDLDRP